MKALRIINMEGMTAIQSLQLSVFPPPRHLLQMLLGRNPAIAPAKQQCRAARSEPVAPVIADHLVLR